MLHIIQLSGFNNENNLESWLLKAFTCSNSTKGTLEKGVKDVKVNNKDTQTTSMNIFKYTSHIALMFLLLT